MPTLTQIVRDGVDEGSGLNRDLPTRPINIVVNKTLHDDFVHICRRHGWTQRSVVAALVGAFVADAEREKG